MAKDDKDEPDLFDALGAREARDEGIELVTDHSSDWMVRARIKLRRLPVGWLGTGEEMRLRFFSDGLEAPHHHNAWGALVLWGVKNGLLHWTHQICNARTRKSHARAVKIYRRGG